nr:4704_t:CDS:2 [Entrophospora candida]
MKMSEGGYSAIYSAVWLEGPKWIYDEASEDYTRTGPTKVALKRFNNLNSITGVISWRDMIDMLWDISCGLEKIHSQDLFHGNLHGGNLLIEEENVSTDAKLADVGFYGPVNQRPTARELTKIFSDWIYDMCDNPNETEISIDFSKAEDERQLLFETILMLDVVFRC